MQIFLKCGYSKWMGCGEGGAGRGGHKTGNVNFTNSTEIVCEKF